MAKHIQEYKYLIQRIAEVELEIEKWINVEKNEELLDALQRRMKSGKVTWNQNYMKVGRKIIQSFK